MFRIFNTFTSIQRWVNNVYHGYQCMHYEWAQTATCRITCRPLRIKIVSSLICKLYDMLLSSANVCLSVTCTYTVCYWYFCQAIWQPIMKYVCSFSEYFQTRYSSWLLPCSHVLCIDVQFQFSMFLDRIVGYTIAIMVRKFLCIVLMRYNKKKTVLPGVCFLKLNMIQSKILYCCAVLSKQLQKKLSLHLHFFHCCAGKSLYACCWSYTIEKYTISI